MKTRVFVSGGIYVAHLRPDNVYIVHYRDTSVMRSDPRQILKLLKLSKGTPTRNDLEEFLGLTPPSSPKEEKEVKPKTII